MTSTVEDTSKFARDGYAIFPSVLDADLIAEMNEHLIWLAAHHPAETTEGLDHGPVADDPFWARVVSDPRLLDIASRFIGDNIALYASQYIVKPPLVGKPVLLHQDSSYWPIEPVEVVTLWVAVDNVDRENGCMRVVPGTHTMSPQELRIRDDVDSVLGSEIAVDIDDSTAVDIELAAGDVEVHHPNIVHGSHANASPRRRAGLTIRYIPTTTRILDPTWRTAQLLRGEAVPGLNTYMDRPRYVSGYHMPFRGSEDWL